VVLGKLGRAADDTYVVWLWWIAFIRRVIDSIGEGWFPRERSGVVICSHLKSTPFARDLSLYSSKKVFWQGILLDMVEMKCIIYGHVQGVQYRVYAQDSAVALDLVGYVKNNPDGSVEVLAQGLPDVLKAFVEYLYEGSLLAKVESVSVEWQTARKTFTEFSVLH
jgi:acylphosphatase